MIPLKICQISTLVPPFAPVCLGVCVGMWTCSAEMKPMEGDKLVWFSRGFAQMRIGQAWHALVSLQSRNVPA